MRHNEVVATPSGIPGIRDLAWGCHICQWVVKRDDLARTLAPYFAAGLKNNERCLWVTAAPYDAYDARRDLEKIVAGLEQRIAGNQLRIDNADNLDGVDVFEQWLAEERDALAAGYTGLRIACNTSFVGEDDWQSFIDRENAFNFALSQKPRIVALCSYNVLEVTPKTMLKAVRSHHSTIQQAGPYWKKLKI
jgi:two-component system, sensor histidine kinase PdtaS